MSGIGALNNALLGIQRGLEGARKNAADIASAEQFTADAPTDLAQSMVELKLNTLQVKASAKAMEMIDEALGSFIDVKV